MSVISTVMNQNALEITQVIPLSNSSVARRIDEMADDLNKQLSASLQVQKCALQIHEYTLSVNEAMLMLFVRFLNIINLKEETLLPEN